MFFLSDSSLKNRSGIENRLIQIGDLAIKISVVDFGYPQDAGLRTSSRQNEMYLDESIDTGCDGYKNRSYHQTGQALDFYAYVDGKASWNKYHMAMVASAHLQAASILGYKLEWGGLWQRRKDMPHLQLAED